MDVDWADCAVIAHFIISPKIEYNIILTSQLVISSISLTERSEIEERLCYMEEEAGSESGIFIPHVGCSSPSFDLVHHVSVYSPPSPTPCQACGIIVHVVN